MTFVCGDCGVEFEWDESPSEELCVACWHPTPDEEMEWAS